MDYASLPEEGMIRAEIESVFDQLRSTDKDGRTSFGERWLNDRGLLLDDGALEVAKAAHIAFFTKNNSHSVIMELERELVSWVFNLLNAEHGAAGTLTSGGSESLFLATAAALANFQATHDFDTCRAQ
jgi:glutamate/tyrosine decarboxylase-like PLP-dependent enzyme